MESSPFPTGGFRSEAALPAGSQSHCHEVTMPPFDYQSLLKHLLRHAVAWAPDPYMLRYNARLDHNI